MGGFCESGNEPSGSSKCRESLLAENLCGFQEELRSMEFESLFLLFSSPIRNYRLIHINSQKSKS